jgi:hypothetical protein
VVNLLKNFQFVSESIYNLLFLAILKVEILIYCHALLQNCLIPVNAHYFLTLKTVFKIFQMVDIR